MAKYGCPNCHKNENIIETVIEVYSYQGQFDSDGEIIDDNPQRDDAYSEGYFCVDCQKAFDQPELLAK